MKQDVAMEDLKIRCCTGGHSDGWHLKIRCCRGCVLQQKTLKKYTLQSGEILTEDIEKWAVARGAL